MGSTIESKTSIFKSIRKNLNVKKLFSKSITNAYMDAYSDGIQVFTVFLNLKKL